MTSQLYVTDAPPQRPSLHLPSLVGLRALAAGMVFIYHLRNMSYFTGVPQDILTGVFGAGSSAVSLFFVLSGFVLAWSHVAGAAITTTWWRRFVRIYPLHIVGLMAAVGVGATMYPSIQTNDAHALLANAGLVSAWRADWWQAGNPVSWSLVCEAFFYLLFPFLIRGVQRLSTFGVVAITVISLVATWCVPFLLAEVLPEVSAYSNPASRLPEFIFGIGIATLMRHHGWVGPRLIVSAPVAILGYTVASLNTQSPLSAAAFTLVGFGLLIAALARRDLEHKRGILSTRAFAVAGKASFAFYVIHLLCLQAVLGTFPGVRADLLTALAGTALAAFAAGALALALHYGVESPIVKVLSGRHWLSPSGSRASGRPMRAVRSGSGNTEAQQSSSRLHFATHSSEATPASTVNGSQTAGDVASDAGVQRSPM